MRGHEENYPEFMKLLGSGYPADPAVAPATNAT